MSSSSSSAVQVLLDSNAIFNAFYGRKAVVFATLEELAKRKHIVIHLSEIVVGELKSQIQEHIRDCKMTEAISALSKITSTSLMGQIDDLRTNVQTVCATIETQIQNEIESWIIDCGVVVHKIAPEHATNVFKKYFNGLPPFKHVKSKNDLPDAFIVEVALDLAKVFTCVEVVCADEAMAGALIEADGINVHRDLHGLLRSGNLPFKTTQEDYAHLKTIREDSAEIERLAKNVLYEQLPFLSLNIENLGIDEQIVQLSIERLATLEKWQLDLHSIVPMGSLNYAARFIADVTLEGSYTVRAEDWKGGIFNILDRKSLMGDYVVGLTGTFLIDAGGLASGNPWRLELEQVNAMKAKRGRPDFDASLLPENLIVSFSDSAVLKQILGNGSGLILVVGRIKIRREAAAASLLAEAAALHPEELFLRMSEFVGPNPVGNITMFDARIMLADGFSDLESDGERVYKKISALAPMGVAITVSSSSEYDVALGLAARGILVIVAFPSKTEEELPSHVFLDVPLPDAVVKAR